MSSVMKSFFKDFEQNSSLGETGALVSQFADVFLVAGPQGVQVVPANAFALALPARKKQFDAMGCQSTELVSLRETPMSDQYVVAETEWQMTFTHGGKSPEKILVASTFIVYTGGGQAKIVFYLPHHDPLTILRNRGTGV
jgi:hypothetical protein